MKILKGLFVVEGLDGSGKTTLAQALERKYSDIICTMQPSTGPIGCKIREILKHQEIVEPKQLLELFVEDRRQHQKWICQQIEEGHRIVLDRYVLSTLAYQGLYFSYDEIWEFNKDFVVPEVLFFINLSPSLALERKTQQISQKGQKLEFFEVLEFQEKIWNNYQTAILFLVEQGYRIIQLDGHLSQEELLSQCEKNL